jgi:hypothetical protein
MKSVKLGPIGARRVFGGPFVLSAEIKKSLYFLALLPFSTGRKSG